MVYIHVSGLYEQPQRFGEIALFRRTAVVREMFSKVSVVTDNNQMMKTIIINLGGITGRLKGAVTNKKCSQAQAALQSSRTDIRGIVHYEFVPTGQTVN